MVAHGINDLHGIFGAQTHEPWTEYRMQDQEIDNLWRRIKETRAPTEDTHVSATVKTSDLWKRFIAESMGYGSVAHAGYFYC